MYRCIDKSTERAFSGKYTDYKEPSFYKYVCCGNDLFNSDTNLFLVQDGLVFGHQRVTRIKKQKDHVYS